MATTDQKTLLRGLCKRHRVIHWETSGFGKTSEPKQLASELWPVNRLNIIPFFNL
jgi:hypothetical protein